MVYGNWGHGLGLGFGWIFTVIFWMLIIWAILSLVHRLNSDKENSKCCGDHNMPVKNNSALDILNERYAKGEIKKDEYEEKKKDIIQ